MKRLLACACLFLFACGDDDDDDNHADADAAVADSGPPVIDAALECPDPAPAPDDCEYFLSCGCKTDGTEKCTIQSGTRGCYSVGENAVGSTCIDDGDCEAASLCATQDSGKTSFCMAFCDAAHPCAGADTACYVQIPAHPEVKLCGATCDLLTQNCADSQGCYADRSVHNVAGEGICVQAGELTAGQPGCESANDCAKGHTCIARDSTCRALCDRTAKAPCPEAQECKSIVGQPVVGYCE